MAEIADIKDDFVFFLDNLSKFKEDIDYKVPGYFDYFSVRLKFGEKTIFRFHSPLLVNHLSALSAGSSVNLNTPGEKPSLLISLNNLVTMISELFDFSLCPAANKEDMNPVDEFFHNILKKIDICTEDQLHTPNTKQLTLPDLKHIEAFSIKHISMLKNLHAQIDHETEIRLQSFTPVTIKKNDGFILTYYTNNNNGKPTIVLVNAYGMGNAIWKYLIFLLYDKYNFIFWNSRGCNKKDQYLSLEPGKHVEDLKDIIASENPGQSHFVCWCSGLKIVLEYYKQNPLFFKTLSIITGYFEPQKTEAAHLSNFDKSIGNISKMVVRNPRLAGKLRPAIEKIFTYKVKKDLFENNNPESMNTILKERIGSINSKTKNIVIKPFLEPELFYNYARMTIELQLHSITGIMEALTIPTLVISADNDIISHPASTAEAYRKLKTSCMHRVLENATHWCLWDNYNEIVPLMESYLEKYN